MNWVKKQKLQAIEALQYNRCPYIKLNNVVATTHHSRTNDLTTSKALQWAIK